MRFYLLAALALFFAASTGCRNVNLCNDCGGKHHGMLGHNGHGHGHGHGHGYGDGYPGGYANHGAAGYKIGAHHREYIGPQGPPTAQVAYPYYTVRGPRDFLIDNPPSIGP
jgi:hypothetical protein